MEIAHRHTSVLRTVAKVVLLGLLVVFLAKAILSLLAIVLVGLAFWLGARALYFRRNSLSRIAAQINQTVSDSVAAAFRLIVALAAMTGWLVVGTVWACRVLCSVVGRIVRIGLGVALHVLGQCTRLLAWAVLTLLFYGTRT